MEIHAISSLPDFEEAHALINAMGKWDAEQSRKFGVPDVELMEYIYGHTVETLMEKFSQRGAGFSWPAWTNMLPGALATRSQMTVLPNYKKCMFAPRREAKALRRA